MSGAMTRPMATLSTKLTDAWVPEGKTMRMRTP
jgi:hypothetical protein